MNTSGIVWVAFFAGLRGIEWVILGRGTNPFGLLPPFGSKRREFAADCRIGTLFRHGQEALFLKDKIAGRS